MRSKTIKWIFKHSWRTYQKRILNNFEAHLKDNKLHIIAPPGSGKTVLGLQAAILLDQPTLILAPTITIKNQWLQRLSKDFETNENLSNKISLTIKDPKYWTISTYQGLHAAVNNDTNKLLEKLNQIEIKTLIVDECHHLQKAWWKSLEKINQSLEPTIIALTATPPYDVSGTEWRRYMKLCGSIDEEIHVAELVAEKNLCPHQDYIYFSSPTDNEERIISSFRNLINEFYEELRLNRAFVQTIKEHPFLQNPEDHMEEIYQNPAFFSSMLILINGLGSVIPVNAIGIIGVDETNLPSLSLEWLEIFFTNALYKDTYFQNDTKNNILQNIERQLKNIGAVEKRKVKLHAPDRIDKMLRSSRSKLNSIISIVKAEYKAMKEALRMVILTDYIRKEALPKNPLDLKVIDLIGVVPIFEKIRRQFPIEIELGVLTGSLVIVPKYSEALLEKILKEYKIPNDYVTKKPLPHDDDYYLLSLKGKYQSKIVTVVTTLFERGGITVLVGTKSLLGEGWDAPTINTLILATFVGSFVLSNQMRGRAIRTIAHDKQKTANIWHLVCIDPKDSTGGNDFQQLKRRFKAFHGISFQPKPSIENGIDRFLLPLLPFTPKDIAALNHNMIDHAANRLRLQKDWEEGISKGLHLVEEVKVPIVKDKQHSIVQSFLLTKTDKIINITFENFISNVFMVLGFSLLLSLFCFFTSSLFWKQFIPSFIALFSILYIIFNFNYIKNEIKKIHFVKQITDTIQPFPKYRILWRNVLVTLGILIASIIFFTSWSSLFSFALSFISFTWIALIFFDKKSILNAWNRLETHRKPSQHIGYLSNALLDTMLELGLIKTPRKNLQLRINTIEKDTVECILLGTNGYEEQLFMNSLLEMLSPIDNPKYILKLEENFQDKVKEIQYITIPKTISRNRKNIDFFYKSLPNIWEKKEIIYTRNPKGREVLLKARGQSLIHHKNKLAQRLSVWR